VQHAGHGLPTGSVGVSLLYQLVLFHTAPAYDVLWPLSVMDVAEFYNFMYTPGGGKKLGRNLHR